MRGRWKVRVGSALAAAIGSMAFFLVFMTQTSGIAGVHDAVGGSGGGGSEPTVAGKACCSARVADAAGASTGGATSPQRASRSGGASFGAASSPQGNSSAGSAAPHVPWHITGNLSEACTCSVPCTCNFDGSPSPNHYCYALFSLDIEKGRYGDTKLDGIRLAGANAAKGTVWYIDERANEAQIAALHAIGDEINRKVVGYWRGVDPKIVEDPQFSLLGYKTTKIVQEATERGNLLRIGGWGNFESDYLVGIDGKTPILIQNNWSWNITQNIKGKTKRLQYKDEYGNAIDTSATNANQGRFDWSDQTTLYLR